MFINLTLNSKCVDSIPLNAAALQEVKIRKQFNLQFLATGCCLIIILASIIYGYGIQTIFLTILLLIYFYVLNDKEIKRLNDSYGR